ncbi:MAG: alpha/beta hydrolase [Anaerolineae bacterium]|nr:alpha/beta hydrolase [Anaerolineae bacterium]
MNSTIYQSPEGYATLMAFYDANLKRWPIPYECLTVPTRHGETHLIASGSPDAPPLVLMRGAGGNALLWAPAIVHLSQNFRTYAVDVIGESGKSAPNRPSYKGPAYGEWMVDIFDALKIERANVAGTSRGGWLTLKIAHFAPKRINRIVPMCAEGIAPISLKFFWHMFPVLAFPGRKTVTGLLRFLTPSNLPVHEYLVEERAIVYKTFRQSLMKPPMFTDDKLRQISAPTLLLFGEQEVVYDMNAIRMRTAHLPNNFEVDVIPNAGHVLDYDQPEAVSERIVKFIRNGI